MKQRNKKKRLDNRIAAWESMKSDGGSDKKKKYGKQEFTKPGSYKK